MNYLFWCVVFLLFAKQIVSGVPETWILLLKGWHRCLEKSWKTLPSVKARTDGIGWFGCITSGTTSNSYRSGCPLHLEHSVLFILYWYYFVVCFSPPFPFLPNQPRFNPWETSVFMSFIALASLYQTCTSYAFLHKVYVVLTDKF